MQREKEAFNSNISLLLCMQALNSEQQQKVAPLLADLFSEERNAEGKTKIAAIRDLDRAGMIQLIAGSDVVIKPEPTESPDDSYCNLIVRFPGEEQSINCYVSSEEFRTTLAS